MRRLAYLLARLFKWGIAAFVLMTFAMLAWTFLWPDRDVATLDPADAILCLGGDMAADGTLGPAAIARVDRCVEGWRAGRAPLVLFTGAGGRANGPTEAAQMARYGRENGLPDAAILVETASDSTLQNALFSLPLLPDATDIIIVTEAFHLPRSAASFHWAAWSQGRPLTTTLIPSEPVRRNAQSGRIEWRMLTRESLAIWFNLARAAVYTVAPAPSIDWLH